MKTIIGNHLAVKGLVEKITALVILSQPQRPQFLPPTRLLHKSCNTTVPYWENEVAT